VKAENSTRSATWGAGISRDNQQRLAIVKALASNTEKVDFQ